MWTYLWVAGHPYSDLKKGDKVILFDRDQENISTKLTGEYTTDLIVKGFSLDYTILTKR